MSLDDMIKSNDGGNRRGGRPAPTRTSSTRNVGNVRGGRAPARAEAAPRPRATQARARAAPYSTRRNQQQVQDDSNGADANDHMGNTDLRDVAASDRPLLKVSSESKPNSVAGAICNVVRESASGQPPSVMATGPAAINQAVKAIAIARKYLLEEVPPTDVLVYPRFEQDLRSGSNLMFELKKSKPIKREPTEDDLSAKDRTEAHKLAGAIAGRVRDGEEVAITTKGAVPVLVVIKAIALAQSYVADEGITIKFAVQFRDLEDPELRNVPSTFLHFAIIYSS